MRFNPHPTSRPGATSTVIGLDVPGCKFQPSPNLKAGCNILGLLVSDDDTESFNPHPTSRPGATLVDLRIMPHSLSFNPHPTSRPGATLYRLILASLTTVSTLTQPQGRVQQLSLP